MGVYTKEYFLLGVEIDFHEKPLSKTLTEDEEFAFLYEGLSNPRKHEAGQIVQLFEPETGKLTIGYALAVKGEFDDTIGTHVLNEANLTDWRRQYEPLVNKHVTNLLGETPKPEYRIFTHFW